MTIGVRVSVANDVRNAFEQIGFAPFATPEGARFFWGEARKELEEADGEIVVDLIVNGDIENTFCARRQMIEPMTRLDRFAEADFQKVQRGKDD